jgi:hypothetical protein
MHEQLETSSVDTCQHRNRHAGIKSHGGADRDEQTEVELAVRESLRCGNTWRHEDVFDLLETFGAQQLLGYVFRRVADVA